jgi:putative ABC transport system permease protein
MARLLKGALAHKMRLLHTALGVALAVALVCGTFALSDTIDVAFHRASTASPTGVAVVVRSAAKFKAQATSLPERDPVPDSLIATVRAIPGVAAAWGSVWGYAEMVDEKGQAIVPNGSPAIGSSWTPDDVLVAGRPPSGADQVVIDEATAHAFGLTVGDRVKVLFQNAVQEFVIEGLRRVNNLIGSSLATFDLQTTQKVLGQEGHVDQISVKAAVGVDPDALRARIAGALPDKYEAVTDDQAAQEAQKSWTKALGFLTTSLLVFGAIALLVSAFIIFNTFSILVAQRTRELGLLRAIGASRAQVTASVLAEALLVGVVASVAGVLLGYETARGLLLVLRRLGFDVPATSVAFATSTAAVGLACGMGVTLLSAVVPARRATNVSPVAGIGSVAGEDHDRASHRRRAGWGAALTLVGAVEVLAGVGFVGYVRRPLLATGAGAAAILVGIAVAAPLVAPAAARVVGVPLGRLLGEPGLLGRENAIRNPRRTAATAAALMIGIGLIGVVSIMGSSMQASATRSVEQTLKADFVVAPAGTAGASTGVPPLVATRLRQTPGVQLVSEVRGGQWGLDGRTMTLLAVDPDTVTAVNRSDPAEAAATRALSDNGVLVRDTVAARHGWKLGDRVPMAFARTGTQKLRVEGTFASTSVRTDYVISLKAYEANYAQQMDLQVEVLLTRGTSAAEGRARIEKALADLPGVRVMDRSQVLSAQTAQVKRFLVPVTALLGLSVIIALLGIANTLALSVHERTRELGLLRAIGMSRGQLRSMIRSEAVIIAAFGSVLGVLVAIFFGWTLVSSMRGLGVSELVIPVGQLLRWVALAVVAGLCAAALPARRAAKLDVLDAVVKE